MIRRRSLAWMALGWCVVAPNGVLVADVQPIASPGTRVAYALEDKRIPELLLPGDSAVLLKRMFPPLTVSALPIQTRAEALKALKESDALVLLRITQRRGVLDDSQTWVTTRTTGHVLRVLRTGPAVSLRRGELLTAEESGGTISVGGVIVTTDDAPKAVVSVGAEYLAMLGRDPSKPMLNLNALWLLDAHGRVRVELDGADDWRRFLAGMAVDEIAAILRAGRQR